MILSGFARVFPAMMVCSSPSPSPELIFLILLTDVSDEDGDDVECFLCNDSTHSMVGVLIHNVANTITITPDTLEKVYAMY